MKRLFLLAGLACLLMGASCPKQNTTFNTIASAEYAVDSAYKAYLDGVVTGAVKTNDVPAISKKYELFQLAERSAIQAANFNSNAPPSAALTTASVDVLSAISAAKGK